MLLTMNLWMSYLGLLFDKYILQRKMVPRQQHDMMAILSTILYRYGGVEFYRRMLRHGDAASRYLLSSGFHESPNKTLKEEDFKDEFSIEKRRYQQS